MCKAPIAGGEQDMCQFISSGTHSARPLPASRPSGFWRSLKANGILHPDVSQAEVVVAGFPGPNLVIAVHVVITSIELSTLLVITC